MSAEIVFYTNPNSRGRIARWMLEEVAAPYRTEILDYGSSMKSQGYLTINPMGKVPALRHGAAVVTETAAICTYLADAFPAAKLAPQVDARAAYYRWFFFGAGPLEAAVIDTALQVDLPEDKRSMVGYGSLATVLDVLQVEVSDHPYLAGDSFSAADLFVGSQLAWGMHFGLIEKRPAFTDYWTRISDRPAYRRAAELDDAARETQTG